MCLTYRAAGGEEAAILPANYLPQEGERESVSPWVTEWSAKTFSAPPFDVGERVD